MQRSIRKRLYIGLSMLLIAFWGYEWQAGRREHLAILRGDPLIRIEYIEEKYKDILMSTTDRKSIDDIANTLENASQVTGFVNSGPLNGRIVLTYKSGKQKKMLILGRSLIRDDSKLCKSTIDIHNYLKGLLSPEVNATETRP